MPFYARYLYGGAEYSYDDLQDEMLGYHRTIAQTVHIGSAFAQNEWKNDPLEFLDRWPFG